MNNYEQRKKEIGLRIKGERERLGLKKGDFLEQIYKSPKSLKTLKRWEDGKEIPDLDSLALMATLFACDIGYLLGDYDERKRDIADVMKITGLSSGAVNNICYITDRRLKSVLSEMISTYRFNRLVNLISELAKAKAKSDVEKLLNNQFGNISEEYVYAAIASNEAASLISEVSDKLKGCS